MGPIMLDIMGYELSAEEKEILQHPLVGGVIFFSRNYFDHAQLKQLVAQIRQIAPQRLLLAVDQEGGRVQRFRQEFTILPPAQAFASLYPLEQAQKYANMAGWLMASELTALDIDISLAPVLDIGHQSLAIGDRAFHTDPTMILAMASAYIKGMHAAGMKATGKHFPGHGTVRADSHIETPIDPRSIEQIKQHDMTIFKQLIAKNKLDAVMPAHIIYSQIDSLPASGSPYWLKQILRNELNFKGIIFSDDLSMNGASLLGDYPDRATATLAAGCDILLICNNRQGAIAILDHLPHTLQSQANRLFHQSIMQIETLKQSAQWRQAQHIMATIRQEWNQKKYI